MHAQEQTQGLNGAPKWLGSGSHVKWQGKFERNNCFSHFFRCKMKLFPFQLEKCALCYNGNFHAQNRDPRKMWVVFKELQLEGEIISIAVIPLSCGTEGFYIQALN